MGWYILRAWKDTRVAEDLRLASVGVFRPEYKFEYWDRKRSIVACRVNPLFSGHLLLDTDHLPTGVTRHSCSFMRSASGLPLRVPEAELLMLRCMRGDFDIRKDDVETIFEAGTRVVVEFLERTGEIVRKIGKAQFEVQLDAGPTISVGQKGLAIAG